MKIFVTILLSASWFISTGQVKITSAHMPDPGDTIRYTEALLTDLPDMTATGTDHTWDFSDLGIIRQGVHEFRYSYQTPYILSFGFTAIGLKIADSIGQSPLLLTNVYDFYKNSSSGYENIGIGFVPDAIKLPQSGKHSDPDEIYRFPLEYGDTFTSTFALKVTLEALGFPVGEFFREGQRFTHVDGWGKISTPYATGVSCIRVKAVIDSRDSIAISSQQINFGTTTRRVVYKWLSVTEKIPLLEIGGIDVLGNFTPQYIRYRDNYRQAPTPVNADFTASPTTVMEGDTVFFTNTSAGVNLNYTWTIFPFTGWQFVNGTGSTSKDIDISFSDQGLYSVKLVAKGVILSDSITRFEYIRVNQVGSAPEADDLYIRIYPSPADNTVFLQNGSTENMKYTLVDMLGRTIDEGTVGPNTVHAVSINTLPDGVYSIIFDAQGSTGTHRFVIRK